MCGETAEVASPVLRREGGEGSKRGSGSGGIPGSWEMPGKRGPHLTPPASPTLEQTPALNPDLSDGPSLSHVKPLNGFTLQARNLGPHSCSSSSLKCSRGKGAAIRYRQRTSLRTDARRAPLQGTVTLALHCQERGYTNGAGDGGHAVPRGCVHLGSEGLCPAAANRDTAQRLRVTELPQVGFSQVMACEQLPSQKTRPHEARWEEA